MLRNHWTRAAVVLFLLVPAAQAQSIKDPDPLFQDSGIVEIRLVAPFSKIMSQRSTENAFDGQLHLSDDAGISREFEIKVSARGRYRLQKTVCPFAPLRLNFKKSTTGGTLFEKQDKLKLVTHCKNNSKLYEQLMLREYLAYQILDQLTDISFRVRLLRITYQDTDERKPQHTAYGFFVEHKDRLAKRLGLKTIEVASIRVSELEPSHMNLISVFHYLIGNTDFSPVLGSKEACCHNHVLIGTDGDLAYSVPYDFDQSGIVDAQYAGASPRFRLFSVRQRLYRGRCANNTFLDETLEKYRQQRDAIMELPNEQTGLSEPTRKYLLKYIRLFYAVIDSPKEVKRRLIKKCT